MRTLDSVIRSYIGQTGRVTLHKYQKYLEYATNVLREIHYDIDGTNITKQLTVQNTGVAYLPNDLVNLVRVFMTTSDGTITELAEDRDLNPRGDDDCGQDVRIGGGHPKADIFPTAETFQQHIKNGELVGREYGLGGGTIYKYRYNKERGRLEFSTAVKTPVYIDYIGNPNRVDGKLTLNDMAVNAVQTGIRYYELRFRNNIPAVQIQQAQMAYDAALHHYNVRVGSKSLFEMRNNKRKSFKQSPKY